MLWWLPCVVPSMECFVCALFCVSCISVVRCCLYAALCRALSCINIINLHAGEQAHSRSRPGAVQGSQRQPGVDTDRHHLPLAHARLLLLLLRHAQDLASTAASHPRRLYYSQARGSTRRRRSQNTTTLTFAAVLCRLLFAILFAIFCELFLPVGKQSMGTLGALLQL